MSEAALSLAFHDGAGGRHGALRSGATILFDGRNATPAQAADLSAEDGGFRARLDGELDLRWEPAGEPVSLGGARTSVCRVTGELRGAAIECLGTASEIERALPWDEFDSARSITAVFDPLSAVLVVARRPVGAPGHGAELTEGAIVAEGRPVAVERVRVSTVYDRDGRQMTAGLELWVPGEEFPRRAFGTVTAGTTLELEALTVREAVFGWRMEGREGAGAYELVTASEPRVAA